MTLGAGDLPPGRSLVLVGMMGAGKSAVGRRLAARLGLPFVDADAEIEAAAGCSIADIFEVHGEPAFREGERKVIARLLDGPPRVIATGGGAFMSEETRALIAAKAISIWLRADLETLVARVARRSHRPLLRDGDPRRILSALSAERDPVYALADVIVESDDAPLATMVNRVLAAVAAFLGAAATDRTT